MTGFTFDPAELRRFLDAAWAWRDAPSSRDVYEDGIRFVIWPDGQAFVEYFDGRNGAMTRLMSAREVTGNAEFAVSRVVAEEFAGGSTERSLRVDTAAGIVAVSDGQSTRPAPTIDPDRMWPIPPLGQGSSSTVHVYREALLGALRDHAAAESEVSVVAAGESVTVAPAAGGAGAEVPAPSAARDPFTVRYPGQRLASAAHWLTSTSSRFALMSSCVDPVDGETWFHLTCGPHTVFTLEPRLIGAPA